MLQLPQRILIAIVLLFFLVTVPTGVFAQTKAGINVGDHFGEIGPAAKAIGENSWLYVMGCPGDARTIVQSVNDSKVNLNLMIRGHYPGQKLTAEVAKAWVAALGDIPDEGFPNKVYFMPINEPNNPVDWVDPNEVVAYINDLKEALNRSGLHETRVVFLSPMLDTYYFYDQLHPKPGSDARPFDYAEQLKRGTFFSQFDGISFGLYGQFAGNDLDPNAPGIKKGQGFRDFIETYYGAGMGGKPIYAPETGVIQAADGAVRYKENREQIKKYYSTVGKSNEWEGNPNFKMFAIFSYDPNQADKSPWIYDAQDVIDVMKNVTVKNDADKKVQEASPLHKNSQLEAKYQSWRQSAGVAPANFTNCGKDNTQTIAVTDTEALGQILKISKTQLSIDKDINITLELEHAGGQSANTAQSTDLREANREWAAINQTSSQARDALLPLGFDNLKNEPPAPIHKPALFAPVCKVTFDSILGDLKSSNGGNVCGYFEEADNSWKPQPSGTPCQEVYATTCETDGITKCKKFGVCDGAGTDGTHCSFGNGSQCDKKCVHPPSQDELKKRVKVHIKAKDDKNFDKQASQEYSQNLYPDKVLQGLLIPGQSLANKPMRLVSSSDLVSDKYAEPLDDCSENALAHLDRAVEVTSRGSIKIGSDLGSQTTELLKTIFGDLLSLFQPRELVFNHFTVYLQFRGVRKQAQQNQIALAGVKEGLYRAPCPLGYCDFVDDSETTAHITVKGGDQWSTVDSADGANVLGANTKKCTTTGSKQICDPNPKDFVSTQTEKAAICAYTPIDTQKWIDEGCADLKFSEKKSCTINQGASFKRLKAQTNSCDPNVTFSWEKLPGAKRYKVDYQPIRFGQDGKPYDNDADWHPTPDHWVTTTSDTINIKFLDINFNHDYWWRVLAMDDCDTQVRAQSDPSGDPTAHNAAGFTDRGIVRIAC